MSKILKDAPAVVLTSYATVDNIKTTVKELYLGLLKIRSTFLRQKTTKISSTVNKNAVNCEMQ